MMRTNTDVTIYNKHRDKDGVVTFNRVYLPAVFWEVRKGASINDRGLTAADGLSLYIDYNQQPGAEYIDPIAYADKTSVTGYWTLTEGEDYAAKGNVLKSKATLTEDELKQMKRKNHECYKITTVDPKLYGNKRLWHWEVGGK